MMRPSRRKPLVLGPNETLVPPPETLRAADAAPEPEHLDYDRKPIVVHGLEHYVQSIDNPRFGVR